MRENGLETVDEDVRQRSFLITEGAGRYSEGGQYAVLRPSSLPDMDFTTPGQKMGHAPFATMDYYDQKYRDLCPATCAALTK